MSGNYIGTDVNGTAAIGNSQSGVSIAGADNIVGGTTAGAGNLISGNSQEGVEISTSDATGNKVEGNLIGTNAAGTSALANGFTGVTILDASNNTVGGTTSSARNVISGNTQHGVLIQKSSASATGNRVEGNYIGTDINGTADVGNVLEGILITGGATSNTVGGSTTGAGNVISGNDRYGVRLNASGTSSNTISGNTIGLNAAGSADLGNTNTGILIDGGAANNLVGGTSAAQRNVISGNDFGGIQIIGSGTTGNQVFGNYIGLNKAGTTVVANALQGVKLATGATSNTIGGTTAGHRNVISGNVQNGIQIQNAGTDNNTIQGNYIGTDAGGTVDLGNAFDGINLADGANNTIGGTAVGAGNLIAFNDITGIRMTTSTAVGNAILGNSIHSNTSFGIDVNNDGVTINDAGDGDTGANNLQNFPVLTGPPPGGTNATGTLNSTASTTFRIEFFASTSCESNGYGEGETYLDFTNVTTDGGGNANINYTLSTPLPSDKFVTATATDPSNNTSEFSLCGPVPTISSISPCRVRWVIR